MSLNPNNLCYDHSHKNRASVCWFQPDAILHSKQQSLLSIKAFFRCPHFLQKRFNPHQAPSPSSSFTKWYCAISKQINSINPKIYEFDKLLNDTCLSCKLIIQTTSTRLFTQTFILSSLNYFTSRAKLITTKGETIWTLRKTWTLKKYFSQPRTLQINLDKRGTR